MRIVQFIKPRLERVEGEIVSVDDGSAAVFVDEGAAVYIDVDDDETADDVEGTDEAEQPATDATDTTERLPAGTDTGEQLTTGDTPVDPPAATPATSDVATDKSTEPTPAPRTGRGGRGAAGKPEAQVD